MLIYYIILVFLIVLMLNEHRLTKDTEKFFLCLCSLGLMLFASMRGSGVDFDYSNYLRLFNQVHTLPTLFKQPISFFNVINREPSYILICSLIKTFFGSNSFQIVTITYAVLSVSLISIAIDKLSDFRLSSLLIFFSFYFLLQHMTQIRTAVATGLILLSLPYVIEKNLAKFLLFTLCGTLFHYSAIIILPIYFLSSSHLNKTLYITLISISIILAILHFTPFDFIMRYDLGIYTEKIKAYLLSKKYDNRAINIFNFSILFQLLMTLFFIFYSDKIKNKYIFLLTKISCWGIIIFYILSASPVLAFRLSDMFNIILIILLPLFYHIIRPKAFAEIVILLISLAYFTNQIVINPILNPYKLFF